MTFNGQPVWVGQIGRAVATQFATGPLKYKVDADVDEARTYMLQALWYARKLERIGYVKGVDANPPTEPRYNLDANGWFTDGLRVVLWVAPASVPFEDVEFAEWDQPPPRVKASG